MMLFFVFKQKTAYEMRISDWSSDVCSSDLTDLELDEDLGTPYVFIVDKNGSLRGRDDDEDEGTKYGFNATSVAELNNKMTDDVKIVLAEYRKIGRASCRERVCQYV